MSTPVDELAVNVLATLHKPSVPSETKLAQLNSLKSSIKHQRIPEAAQHNAAECIRLAIASQTSSSLVAAGFSSLSHLVKRLALQEQMSVLVSQRTGLLAILLERLGDAKEPYRSSASQAFCDIWPSKPAEVEKAIREGPLVNGNSRAKLAAMQWVTKMHEEHNLQFRSFVPPIVACLEDADGTVRDSAKLNLVELFRASRDGAKADLKKQLLAYNVRKSIANYILSQLGLPTQSDSTSHSHNTHRSETPMGDSSLTETAEPTLPPSVEVANIEPLHVYSARELEDIFRQMQPCFEDKEKEDNWKARDNSILKLRRLLKGNVPTEHGALYLAGVKDNLDSIFKVIHSLRTTLSTNGCQYMQELARTFGPGIDSMADIILRGLEKMCSNTKHIAAQNGNTTTDTVLAYVSYNVRFMQHIWAAMNDKNVQPRTFACGWLQTMLKRVVYNKSQFDHSGGLEMADKCIRKGLSDANPKVRETMRGTYWLFAASWPDRAAAIMSTLDAKSKQLLEKDQNNPNAAPTSSTFSRSVGPDSGANPRLAATTSRASLKEHIAAQKKATLAAKRIPERPNSAMSTFSPIKEAPSSARRGAPQGLASTSSARGPSASRQISTSSQVSNSGQGSLMSAPMRRPRKPDVPRPATAEPYGSGKASQEATPPTSPKGPTLASHAKSKSTSATATGAQPVFSASSSRGTSPRTSPIKQKQSSSQLSSRDPPSRFARSDHRVLSPPRHYDSFTSGKSTQKSFLVASQPAQTETERPDSGHSSIMETLEEDNFTLVIPEKSQIYKSEHTSNGQNRNMGLDKTEDEPVMVYEDPTDDDKTETPQVENVLPVLEEVPPNEQNVPAPQPSEIVESMDDIIITEDQQRPVSPKKLPEATETPDTANVMPSQDRAEILKTRRLLSSGVERVRARTLDAHGFRRLQDLVKTYAQIPDLQFGPLLAALLAYLVEPNELLKTNASKAAALKSQALSTARAIQTVNRRDPEVYGFTPSAIRAFIDATETCDSSSSHAFMELEKAVEDLIKRTEPDTHQIASCIHTVIELAQSEAEPSPRNSTSDQKHARLAYSRKMTTALSALTKLVTLPSATNAMQKTETNIRQQLGDLAVKFLGSSDADIRRRAVEFTVAVYGCFPADPDGGKSAFWKVLRPAGEQQCNLVAYYLARKERT